MTRILQRRYWATVNRWPLSLLAIAIPLVVYALDLAFSWHKTFLSGGDVGFIELSVRSVFHGGTALGAYSRYGWHHPGPLFLYLFAPIYWVSGSNSRALFLDSWLLNSGCALLATYMVRRYVNENVARIAALVLIGYMAAIGHFALINPWNPSLLAFPVLLCLVAGACAAGGSLGALAVAFLAGSLAVQTHLGTAPIVGISLFAATVACCFRLWKGHRAKSDTAIFRWPAVVGLVLVVAVWVPPIYQQLTSSNGNLSQIAHFYAHPPTDAGQTSHTLNESVSVISDYATLVPYGAPLDNNGHRNRLLAVGAFGLLGCVVGVVGWRKERVLAWFGIIGSGGLVVAVIAASRVIGPFYGYLFTWTSVLGALPAIGAIGLIVQFARGVRLQTVTSAAALVVLVLGSGAFVDYVNAADLQSFRDSPEGRAAATQIEAAVNHDKQKTFEINVVSFGFDDGALMLQLAKDGYSYRLNKEIDLYYGTTTRMVVGPTFYLGSVSDPTTALPGTPLLTDDDLVVNISA